MYNVKVRLLMYVHRGNPAYQKESKRLRIVCEGERFSNADIATGYSLSSTFTPMSNRKLLLCEMSDIHTSPHYWQ